MTGHKKSHTSDSNRRRDASSWATNECSTGKRAHATRESAKAQRTRMAKVSGRMDIYRCDECGMFHLGHLPRAVREGKVSRNEYYGRGDGA